MITITDTNTINTTVNTIIEDTTTMSTINTITNLHINIINEPILDINPTDHDEPETIFL